MDELPMRWAIVGAVLVFGIAVSGATACDMREKQQQKEMAERGFCQVQNGYYIPCALPVVSK